MFVFDIIMPLINVIHSVCKVRYMIGVYDKGKSIYMGEAVL